MIAPNSVSSRVYYPTVIENRISGERFKTFATEITKKDVPRLDKKSWLFDWEKEHKQTDRAVFKLTTVENPDVIQGLISLSDLNDHVFVSLVESAPFNRGKDRLYVGAGAIGLPLPVSSRLIKGMMGILFLNQKPSC